MSKESAALATTGGSNLPVIADFALPVVTEEMKAAMAEEMEGMDLKFDRVKVPSGGGIMWEIPNPDDPENPIMSKELIGVIVDHHPINAWWKEKYSGQKNPPDCFSLDGKMGLNTKTGELRPCVTCPMNQWGTAVDDKGNPTKGKACKNMRRVYLMQPGNMFPILLAVPPTSLPAINDYISKRIVSRNRRSYDVVTKITLKKEKNAGGIEYSACVFGIAGALEENLRKQAEAYSMQIKPITRTIQIAEEEYYIEGENGKGAYRPAGPSPGGHNPAKEEDSPY